MNKISERLLKDSRRLAEEACRHFGTELEYAIGGDALIAKNDALAIEQLVLAATTMLIADDLYVKMNPIVPGSEGLNAAKKRLSEALKPFSEET